MTPLAVFPAHPRTATTESPDSGSAGSEQDALLAGDSAPELIARKVASYTPTCLTAGIWQQVAGPLRDLVLRSAPSSQVDARMLLGNACRFLAWAAPLAGTTSLPVVLTDVWINRYAVAHKGQRNEGTLGLEVSRLRRLVRTLAGEPARTQRGPASVGAAPYDAAEVALLARAGLPLDTLLGWLRPAPLGLAGVATLDPRWQAARALAAGRGVALTWDRLQATATATALLGHDLPLGLLVARHGLTRRALEGIAPHLPRPEPQSSLALLRG